MGNAPVWENLTENWLKQSRLSGQYDHAKLKFVRFLLLQSCWYVGAGLPLVQRIIDFLSLFMSCWRVSCNCKEIVEIEKRFILRPTTSQAELLHRQTINMNKEADESFIHSHKDTGHDSEVLKKPDFYKMKMTFYCVDLMCWVELTKLNTVTTRCWGQTLTSECDLKYFWEILCTRH